VADDKQQQQGGQRAAADSKASDAKASDAKTTEQDAPAEYPAKFETPKPRPENMGGAPGGDPGDGYGPTGDKAPDSVLALHEALAQYPPVSRDPYFNPTTPDGSPPPNNLPGPHGPQGVEHLQQDPTES
jgi:hypothetical protein